MLSFEVPLSLLWDTDGVFYYDFATYQYECFMRTSCAGSWPEIMTTIGGPHTERSWNNVFSGTSPARAHWISKL